MSGNLIAGVLFFTFLVYITTKGQLPAYLALLMPAGASASAPVSSQTGVASPAPVAASQAQQTGAGASTSSAGAVPASDGSISSDDYLEGTIENLTGGKHIINPDVPGGGQGYGAPDGLWSDLPPGTVPFKIPGSNQTIDFPAS